MSLDVPAAAAVTEVVSVARVANGCRTTVIPVGRHYVVFDRYDNGDIGVWIYEESNGIDGLQRPDERHGSCGQPHQADSLVEGTIIPGTGT